MKVDVLPLDQLSEAPWNPNVMDPSTLTKLKVSIRRFGQVQNLVVRPIPNGFEVINGNQRLKAYRDLNLPTAPCVVVPLGDADARLLAQTLNRLQGEDDLGLRAELLRDVLKVIPEEEVLALLPETAASLRILASVGQDNIVRQLQAWIEAEQIKLKSLTFQLTPSQWDIVDEALARILPLAQPDENPNRKGTALFLLCQTFLTEKRIADNTTKETTRG